MKNILLAAAAMMMLSACTPMAESGCAECEKMAMDANAKHQAMKAAKADDCECCKGGKH